MVGRFQSTELGFILEGEVERAEPAEGPACSVSGSEIDLRRQAELHSLFEALEQYEGRKVRITVEVMEHQPVDTLREVLERFREESEAPDDSFQS